MGSMPAALAYAALTYEQELCRVSLSDSNGSKIFLEFSNRFAVQISRVFEVIGESMGTEQSMLILRCGLINF